MNLKTFLALLLAATFAVIAPSTLSFAADVEKIVNIGKNATSERDAFRVTCTTGTTYVMERRGDWWHSGVVLSQAGIPSSVSPDDMAKRFCARF